MSSVYRLYCCSHDPAIYIGGEWSRPDGWLDSDYLLTHTSCDVVVVRSSGAPVELGCFSEGHGHRTTEAKWFDRDWINLLWVVRRSVAVDSNAAIVAARAPGAMKCLTQRRLDRLSGVFDWGA